MRVKRTTLIEVGLFVFVGAVLALLLIFFIGRERGLFGKTFTLIAPFKDVSGLRDGAMVQLSGIKVGFVDGVRFSSEKEEYLEVILKVSRSYKEYIRKDSKASIQTQGLLGDKYILITKGSFESPPMEDGEVLNTEGIGGITALAERGKHMMEEIEEAARKFNEVLEKLPLEESNREEIQQILSNVKQTTTDLKWIVAKVKKGEGTIGGFLVDPALYHDLRALLGHANRNKLLKNLIRASIAEQEKTTDRSLKDEVKE